MRKYHTKTTKELKNNSELMHSQSQKLNHCMWYNSFDDGQDNCW